jgi:hypothetical protein
LSLGLVLRGWAARSSVGWLPLAGVANRATLVALVAGALSVGHGWRNTAPEGRRPAGWAALIPAAAVAGLGVAVRATMTGTAAPFLLLSVLVAAGLVLWSAGQALDVLLGDREDNFKAAVVAWAGLTVSVVVVGGVNWRVWGTPLGTVTATLGLWAAWLVSAARLVFKSARLAGMLDWLAAVLLVEIALSFQWTWPLG